MLNDFLAFLRSIFFDQRGEIGDLSDDGTNDLDASDDFDDSDDDQNDDQDDDSSDDSDDDDDTDDSDDIDDDDSQDDDDLSKRVAELEAASKTRENHISDLNKALYGYRQEIKKLKAGSDKEDDATFTDAQITKILDEHKDDPAVMLQVFKQVAKQQTAGIKDDAVSATEISQTKSKINDFLHQNWPSLSDENSKEFNELQQAKQWMRVDDHPYGDFLSMGALMMQRMPELIENARKEGKLSALKDKSNSNRKQKIKQTKLAAKGSKAKDIVVSDEIKNTAAEIGITDEKQLALYAKILKNANKGQNSITTGD